MNLAQLGQQDLDKLELDQIPDEGDVNAPDPDLVVVEPVNDTKAGEKEGEGTGGDDNKPEAKAEAGEAEPQPPEAPASQEPKLNKNGEPIEGDPLKDTKAWATKLAEENKRLKAELEDRRRKDLTSGFEDFEILTDDEFEMLSEEDPVAARDYVRRETEYNRRQGEIKQLDQARAASVQDEVYNRTVANVAVFAQKIGVNETELNKFIESPDFLHLTQYVAKNFRPADNGVFSPDQLMDAYKYLNYEKALAKARTSGRQVAINDIIKASGTGSRLEKIQSDGGNTTRPRKLENLTQDEILKMSEAQLNAYLAEID